ncbi:MAG: protein kinase [Candidatus Schekmanbacteria bacterium]|nr:protein kinase [Candidatus Schekmanbacteria bacterium]
MSNAIRQPRIGPFRLLSTLGQGAMGVVHLAVSVETGVSVALKTLAAPTEQHLPAIRREIQALAALRHPNIVRVVAHGVHAGLPWCALELVDGVGLVPFCRKLWHPRAPQGAAHKATNLRALLTVVRRLCEPLAYLHGEGIVHQDLKPDNVLVRSDGQPVIVDFGLVSRFGSGEADEDGWSREVLEKSPSGSGTIPYMAPEILRGELIDARTDLYAVGCMLYELLTEQVPFAEQSSRDMVMAHLRSTPRPPSELVDGIPKALDALIGRLLMKDARARLGYAEDLAAELERLGASRDGLLAGPPPRPYLYRPRFVGREETLETLNDAMPRYGSGHGRLLLLRGESGVGKTRFALEAMHSPRLRGARVMIGECPPPGTGGALLCAFRGPLETLVDHCRTGGRQASDAIIGQRGKALEAYHPSIRDLPGQDAYPEVPELPPDIARQRLYTAFVDSLRAWLGEKPAVLMLDDLQWADELSMGLLQHLAAPTQLTALPVLILATYRREEATAALNGLAAQPAATVIDLQRLDAATVGAMVADMLAMDQPPGELAERLHRYSEGNPFFVAEYLRAAIAAGLLQRDPQGRWQPAGEDWDLALPKSLERLVQRRITDLPAAALKVAQAAAVVGREARLELLGTVTGLDEAELFLAWSELRRREVLDEASGGCLRFAHETIREATYAALSKEEREPLHRLVAEGLEGLVGELDEHLSELGRHWEEAGERERAASCYLRAARRNRRQYGLVEAEASYRAYLRLQTVETAERVEASVELAEGVLYVQGRLREALAELEDADRRAAELGARTVQWRALCTLALVSHDLGKVSDANQMLEEALAIARETGDENGEARTLAAQALQAYQSGQLAAASALFSAARERYGRRGDRLNEGLTLNSLAVIAAAEGNVDGAVALSKEALELLRAAQNRMGEAACLGNLANLLEELGREDEAERLQRSALAILRQVGHRLFEGVTLNNLASLSLNAGNLAEASLLCEQSLPIFRELGHRRFEAHAIYCRARIAADTDHFEQAMSDLDEALAILRQIGDRRVEGAVLLTRSTLQRRRGLLEAAAADLDSAEALLAAAGHVRDRVQVACERGFLALAQGASAAAHIATARQHAATLGAGGGGRVGTILAQLERAQDEREATAGSAAPAVPWQ